MQLLILSAMEHAVIQQPQILSSMPLPLRESFIHSCLEIDEIDEIDEIGERFVKILLVKQFVNNDYDNTIQT